MRELPSAGGRQDGDLDQSPAHNTGVGRFGLITEFGFTFLYIKSVNPLWMTDASRSIVSVGICLLYTSDAADEMD